MSNDVELSIFGPGIGESILVRLSNSKWMVVDSCLNPDTKKPIALEYLKSEKIDTTKEVELIVISHWHDDHIRGIAQIIEACPNANIGISSALLKDEFITLVFALANEDSIVDKETSGLKEMSKVISIINERVDSGQPDPFVHLTESMRFYSESGNECWSLSPSSSSITQSLLSFKEILDDNKNTRKIINKPDKNDFSVVVHVLTPNVNILLGSDLENTSDDSVGWGAVVKSSTKPDQKSHIFKIPHHGSITGHNHDVWQSMLVDNPLSILTCYNRSKLPLERDIKRIKGYTDELYCTTSPISKDKKKIKEDKIVKELTDGLILERHELNQNVGHIKITSDDKSQFKVSRCSLAQKL